MKLKFNKQQVMKHYYSDEEIKDMLRMSVKTTLKWLERARRFVNKITPKKNKKIREWMVAEGW